MFLLKSKKNFLLLIMQTQDHMNEAVKLFCVHLGVVLQEICSVHYTFPKLNNCKTTKVTYINDDYVPSSQY